MLQKYVTDGLIFQLHAHLSGSISRQCLHEIWVRKKAKDPDFPVEDPLVLMPPGKVDYTLQTYAIREIKWSTI